MPRRARVVVPGVPVHIIQRGHDCQPVFFCDDDYWRYLNDLKLASGNSGCAVHAYVLMTNHVHIVATPNTETSLGDMMRSLGARLLGLLIFATSVEALCGRGDSARPSFKATRIYLPATATLN